MMKKAIVTAMLLQVLAGLPGAFAQRLERHPGPPLPLWERSDTVSVVIIGDVMMHARQLQYDHGPFLSQLEDKFSRSDLVIANMEFTLAGEPYSGYPAFSAPDSYAAYVRDLGADVFLTANNHILDKGTSGLERTLSVYRDMDGIRWTGTAADSTEYAGNYPLMLTAGGIRFALVNFTYGTNVPPYSKDFPRVNYMRKEEVASAVQRAREKGADFVIALPHWGEEYILKHNRSQEDFARFLAGEGVDAVVGSHPHVVQDSCTIGSMPVFYSIGNAVSNMSARNTRLELAVTLRFVLRPWDSPRMIAPEVDFLWCTLPGRLVDNYCTIVVKEWLGRRDEWILKSDYDEMVATYERVKSVTGIED